MSYLSYIYTLPRTDELFAEETLARINATLTQKRSLWGEATLRGDIVKLALFSLADVVDHTLAAACQLTASVIKIPGHVIWKSVSPRKAFSEMLMHLARAVQSAVALLVFPFAFVYPECAPRAYSWLGLEGTQSEYGCVHAARRVKNFIVGLAIDRHAAKVVFSLAAATAVFAGIRYFKTSIMPDNVNAMTWSSNPFLLFAGVVSVVLAGAGALAWCCKPAKATQEIAEEGDQIKFHNGTENVTQIVTRANEVGFSTQGRNLEVYHASGFPYTIVTTAAALAAQSKLEAQSAQSAQHSALESSSSSKVIPPTPSIPGDGIPNVEQWITFTHPQARETVTGKVAWADITTTCTGRYLIFLHNDTITGAEKDVSSTDQQTAFFVTSYQIIPPPPSAEGGALSETNELRISDSDF